MSFLHSLPLGELTSGISIVASLYCRFDKRGGGTRPLRLKFPSQLRKSRWMFGRFISLAEIVAQLNIMSIANKNILAQRLIGM